MIYHKNLSNFFLKYFNTHLGNTLLVEDMPYIMCLNSHFNAMFVESYEDLPKEDNYFMKNLLPYLQFIHYFRFSVPTFVELYPFGAINSVKEDDVRFWMLVKKCIAAYCVIFCRNCLTSIASSSNFLFCSFLLILSLIFQIH